MEHHLELLSSKLKEAAQACLCLIPPLPPDSSVGRAPAFRGRGRGFESRRHNTKGVKNGSCSSLADARIKGVVLGR